MNKRCSKCKKTKPATEFFRNRRLKDGYQAWCKPCHSALNKQWFAQNPDRKRELNRRWREDNADRVLVRRREWNDANRARLNATKRAWYAKQDAKVVSGLNRKRNLRKYGLSEHDYRALLERQGGCCAVCGAKPKKRRLSVDHCHNSSVVRGILCDACNIGIGCLGDSVERLRAAAAYLESFDRSREE